MPGRNSIFWWIQNSSESEGAQCSDCRCGLPPNRWYFVSNENQRPRYDDDGICFFTKHDEEQTEYKATFLVSASVTKTIRTKDVLVYVAVGGQRLKPKSYFCLMCFKKEDFGAHMKMSDGDRRAVKNEAITMCINSQIGVPDIPSL